MHQYRSLPTSTLWARQGFTQSVRELAFIEAELARRGETRSGRSYIGRRSAGAVGKARFSRAVASENTRNCTDFSSSLAAQRFFLAAGGPTSDPHDLDRDVDGFACECGTQVRRIASRSQSEIRRTGRPSVTSTCYVGPRGGTYTITASGNRNYDGC
ncbi:MAG: excalibur calcium-binding domain-containing protein [Pseudomonadota bacterium]